MSGFVEMKMTSRELAKYLSGTPIYISEKTARTLANEFYVVHVPFRDITDLGIAGSVKELSWLLQRHDVPSL